MVNSSFPISKVSDSSSHICRVQTLTSNVAPNAILNSPFASFENTLWKVCLNSDVLKESPITM